MRLWPREPLFGPLGAWELVRLARRGQGHRTRLLVLYLLFIAFLVTVILWTSDLTAPFGIAPQSMEVEETPVFGNRFALAILEVTALAVVLLTPAYAATALAEEKESRALDLLLTTPLSDREIIFGKAVGRLGFVLAAVAAVLPVLAATTLFGGVSELGIVCGAVIVAATATVTTGVGIYAATVAPDLRGALVRGYGVIALFVVVTGGPFLAIAGLGVFVADPELEPFTLLWTAGYLIVYLTVGIGLLSLATNAVRHEGAHVARAGGAGSETVLVVSGYEVDRARYLVDLPPVDDSNPIRWRERYVVGRPTRFEAGATMGALSVVRMIFGTVAVLFILIGAAVKLANLLEQWEQQQQYPPERRVGVFARGARPPNDIDVPTSLMLNGSVMALAVYVVPAALSLSAIVAKERRQATLESLLALPLDRGAILRSKAIVVLERGWPLVPIAEAAIGLAFGLDRSWWQGLAAGALVLGGAMLVAGLATWLSVRCPTEVRALRLSMPVVVMAFGLPMAVWNLTPDMAPKWPALAMGSLAILFAVLGLTAWWRAGREFDSIL